MSHAFLSLITYINASWRREGLGSRPKKKKVICTIINKEKWVSSGGVFCTGTNLYQLCIDHQTSIFVDPSPPRLVSVQNTGYTLSKHELQPIPFEMTFSKAQSSKLVGLFSLVCSKRDLRALSFELCKMSFQMG